MKKNIIAIVMSFVFIFVSVSNSFANNYEDINYKPMVVDGGVITAPMVATVVTLAVASGVVLSSNDDIYDICNYFYSQHKENWQPVVDVFNACVEIGANGVVTVGKEFLNLVSSSFDSLFNTNKSDINLINGIPLSPAYLSFPVPAKGSNPVTYSTGIMATNSEGGSGFLRITFGYRGGYPTHPYTANVSVGGVSGGNVFKSSTSSMNISLKLDGSNYYVVCSGQTILVPFTTEDYRYSLPSSPSYDSSIMKDREYLGIYVPGNVDSLVGGNLLGSDVVYEGVLNPPYELPSGGVVALPGVDTPTVDVEDDVFPGVISPPSDIPGVDNPSIPGEGLWASIKDFIISLVVPSDTFWTDTFNSFRDNLNKNFPMLDMSGFDSLLVNGKPFPNIYAFGSIIVNGDIINSIVDWLRPIIAGFIMICLMFFNYRKIYKLIRNTEPFGNIAPGTSDFSTGLSSQDIKQIVADAKREVERRTYRR